MIFLPAPRLPLSLPQSPSSKYRKVINNNNNNNNTHNNKPKPMTSRADDMRELSSQFAPSETDVLCAKGKQAKEHPGNRYLTTLIQSHLKEYSAATTKLDKSFVVSKIIKQVRGAGGLFVRNVKGQWYDIGNRNAREKIGQSFRDLLHEQYKSSTRAKASIRRNRGDTSSEGPGTPTSTPATSSATTSTNTSTHTEHTEATNSNSTTCHSDTESISGMSNKIQDRLLPAPLVNYARPPGRATASKTRDPIETQSNMETLYSSLSRSQPHAHHATMVPDLPLSALEPRPLPPLHSLRVEPNTMLNDIEPLPVTQSLVNLNFDDSMTSIQTEATSFEEAMQDMLTAHFALSNTNATSNANTNVQARFNRVRANMGANVTANISANATATPSSSTRNLHSLNIGSGSNGADCLPSAVFRNTPHPNPNLSTDNPGNQNMMHPAASNYPQHNQQRRTF